MMLTSISSISFSNPICPRDDKYEQILCVPVCTIVNVISSRLKNTWSASKDVQLQPILQKIGLCIHYLSCVLLYL